MVNPLVDCQFWEAHLDKFPIDFHDAVKRFLELNETSGKKKFDLFLMLP